MKLVTFRSPSGEPHVGAVRGMHIVDLTVLLPDRVPGLRSGFEMVDLIEAGDPALSALSDLLGGSNEALERARALVPYDDSLLMAPIQRPRKNIMCLGRNYAEHAAESMRAFGQAAPSAPPPPQFPAVFTKSPNTVIGPFDPIPWAPAVSEKIDWEAELAVVIGRRGVNIEPEEARAYIFGYMVLNDVSARDIQQRHGGQFFKGKSLDGTCPTGPWIVTPDELPEPDRLEIWTRVNGVDKQRDNTSSMLLDVNGTVAALSLGMTLDPGDIIATGTPAGVGHARQPPEFLRPGDIVECGVEGIGTIRNTVGAPPTAGE